MGRSGKWIRLESVYLQNLETLTGLKKRKEKRWWRCGEHPSIAHTLSNLGVLLGRLGKLTEAESVHREALEMRRRTVGEEHEDFTESLNNLAMVHVRRGEYANAEPLMRKTQT